MVDIKRRIDLKGYLIGWSLLHAVAQLGNGAVRLLTLGAVNPRWDVAVINAKMEWKCNHIIRILEAQRAARPSVGCHVVRGGNRP